ncbi:MAG: hypothetical protein ACK5IJ_11905 [Mangrovibacterium sp.]
MKKYKIGQLFLISISVHFLIPIHAQSQRPFITMWEPAGSPISIITKEGYKYNYDIKIYDAASEELLVERKGLSSNMYTLQVYNQLLLVEIYPQPDGSGFPSICFDSIENREKLVGILQWGDVKWENLMSSFYGCKFLQEKPTDVPNLSQCNDMRYMFFDVPIFRKVDVENWTFNAQADTTHMFGKRTHKP